MSHALERSSPKGGPFKGTCTKCGMIDLPMTAAVPRRPPRQRRKSNAGHHQRDRSVTRTHSLPCAVCQTPTPIDDRAVQQVFALRRAGFPKARITATTCRDCVNDRNALPEHDDGDVLDEEPQPLQEVRAVKSRGYMKSALEKTAQIVQNEQAEGDRQISTPACCSITDSDEKPT